MIITSSASTGQIGKQDPGYKIKEPKKVVTDFTVKDATKAADALNLKDDGQISDLKKFLKNTT